MQEEITIICQDMQKVQERTSAIENRVSNNEDTLTFMQRDLKAVGLQAKQHANHIDDLENRLRRSNLWVIGLPEHIEGNNTI